MAEAVHLSRSSTAGRPSDLNTARAARAPYALGMTDQMDSEITEVGGETRATLSWEVPEIAAVVVLVAFGALTVGGLVAGIIFSTSTDGGFPATRQITGEAITFGAAWAGPLLAIALLGVVGLSWWLIETWGEAGDEEPRQFDDLEVQGRMWRAWRIGMAAQIALILTVGGSIAALVGTVMGSLGGGPQNWSRFVIEGASVIGVLVLAVGGWKIGRSARARAGFPGDVP
jgi:hypothetical protein